MTRKLIRVMQCGLEILLQAVIFFSVIALAYFGVLDMPLKMVWKPMYIVLAVVLAYFIRRWMKNFSSFVMLHFMLLFGALVVGETDNESFFLAFLTFIICLFSYVQKKKLREEKPEKMHLALAAVFLVEYLFGYYMENRIVMEFSIWLAAIYIVGQIFYINFDRLDEMYRNNQETHNFPARRLFSTNMVFMTVTSVLVLFGMMLFYNSPFGNIFVLIKNGLLKLLGLILGWLFKGQDEMPNIYIPETETFEIESSSEPESYMDEPYTRGLWQDILNAILIVAGIVLLIALIVALIIAIKRWFAYLASIQGAEGDVIESLDEIEEMSREKEPKREEEISDKDLNIRARRIYKKQLKAARKGKSLPEPSAVPSEITRLFTEEEKEDEITRIYEKARYSDEKISDKEIDFLKKH